MEILFILLHTWTCELFLYLSFKPCTRGIKYGYETIIWMKLVWKKRVGKSLSVVDLSALNSKCLYPAYLRIHTSVARSPVIRNRPRTSEEKLRVTYLKRQLLVHLPTKQSSLLLAAHRAVTSGFSPSITRGQHGPVCLPQETNFFRHLLSTKGHILYDGGRGGPSMPNGLKSAEFTAGGIIRKYAWLIKACQHNVQIFHGAP